MYDRIVKRKNKSIKRMPTRSPSIIKTGSTGCGKGSHGDAQKNRFSLGRDFSFSVHRVYSTLRINLNYSIGNI